jgi:hypothetical protein
LGAAAQVYVNSYSPTTKKLALSFTPPDGSRNKDSSDQQQRLPTPAEEMQELSQTPPKKWLQAVVQRVTPFGLFVRPANYDVTGTHLIRTVVALFHVLITG